MLRETVFAAIFGDSAAADAFFMAFRIPNFLRRLFAEGAFSQAFVPVLSEYRSHKSLQETQAFIHHVAGALGAVLILITLVGVLAAPLLAALFAPGYLDDGPKFDLLVNMLRVTFPYILFISLTGFAGAILNSYGNFGVPALTPVILNVVLIASALFVSPLIAEPAMALAWGVLVAGILQLSFQLPFLQHLKLLPRPRLNWQHSGVKRVLILMLPVMFSVSVGQINLLLDSVLATSIEGDGNVSWLYYSDRLMELPLGMFGIGIATVILPALARIFSTNQQSRFSDTLQWGLRCVLVLGLPASAALIVLAEPMIFTLYQHGAFTVESVSPTSRSLQAYALGLVAFMAIKVLASAYFSRQDTRTPVRFGIITMVANMVMNLLFIVPLAHVGLALATSISATLNAGLLLQGLRKSGVLVPASGWLGYIGKLVLATTMMLLVLSLLTPAQQVWIDWNPLQRVVYLLLICVAGGLTYLLTLLAGGLRIKHFRV